MRPFRLKVLLGILLSLDTDAEMEDALEARREAAVAVADAAVASTQGPGRPKAKKYKPMHREQGRSSSLVGALFEMKQPEPFHTTTTSAYLSC
jgi:hypothetical protein